MTLRCAWIPEAPGHSGLYANRDFASAGEHVGYALVQPSTWSPYDARQFATREECQTWCDLNPHPVFVPVEHGFIEGVHE